MLPAVTDCPLCGSARLHIYQDTLLGGEWHHCRACASTGDMISLAAAYWKLDLTEVVRRLSDDDLDALLPGYVSQRKFYTGMERMVAESRATEQVRVNEAFQKAYLTVVTDKERWKSRLGRFAGVVHKSAYEKAFRSRWQKTSGQYALFPGYKWADVIVVPFYDMPGRVCGCWAFGRENETVFEVFSHVPPKSHRTWETGFGFMDAVTNGPDPTFGDTVFVMNDTLIALKIHDKTFQSSDRPLPVLACHAYGNNWARLNNGTLTGKNLIFWSPVTTREILRQVKIADGSLTAADGVTESPSRQLARYSPKSWLRYVQDNAMHWTLALEKFISTMDHPEMEATLSFMELTIEEKIQFSANCSPETRERMRRMDEHAVLRKVRLNHSYVEERQGCWYVAFDAERVRRLLTDAPFRIEQVIRYDNPIRIYYRVRVTFRRQHLTFNVLAEEFDKRPFAYIKEKVRAAGLGIVNSLSTCSEAITIANYLWPPEFAVGVDRYGWEEKSGAWVFRRFKIDSQGSVAREETPPLHDDPIPTADLRPPAAIHPDDISLLSRRSEATSVVWAAVACVTTNLIAPVANRETCGIALVGEGASLLGRAATRRMGCIQAGLRGVSIKALSAAEREHGWPVVATPSCHTREADSADWYDLQGARNAIVVVDEPAGRVLSLKGGWHVIESRYHANSVNEYDRVLTQVVPTFLQWFAARRMILEKGVTFGDQVLESLAEWFAGIGGDRAEVLRARGVVQFDHGHQPGLVVDRFFGTLCSAVSRKPGMIELPPEGKPPFLTPTEGDNLFISKASLNKLLSFPRPPRLDMTVVTKALTEEDVLLRETDVGDPPQPGWEVRRSWWDKKYSSWRRGYNRSLKPEV